jgi:uncharacterized membrane protein HdeD (DUF308 family)
MNLKEKVDINWAEMLLGVVFVLMGIYTFAHPELTLSGFLVVYGVLAVICGVVDIAFYVHLERHTGFGPVTALVLGIVNGLLGLFLILSPHTAAVIVGLIFPLWFVCHCLVKLLNLNVVRVLSPWRYWWELVVNLVGILLGVLLLLHPFASAVSLVYLAGAYLVVMGLSSILSSFDTYYVEM